jgi:hypothetical protein
MSMYASGKDTSSEHVNTEGACCTIMATKLSEIV